MKFASAIELSSVIIFEIEAYPEPKILMRKELLALMTLYKTTVAVAKFLGCSQAHMYQKDCWQRRKDSNQL